jgi:hypothetical protein
MAMAASVAGGRRQRRRNGRRSALALGAVGALALGAGCAQESDGDLVAGEDTTATGGSAGFAATPDYIDHVVDTAESESYRYTMTMDIDMFGSATSVELAEGAYSDQKNEMTMDFGAMLDAMGSQTGEEMPAGLDGADLTMSQVVTPDTMYIRAPFFSAMADQAGGLGTGGLDVFTELGDDWGKVDMGALGDVLPGDAQRAMTGQSADPTVFLEMLRSTESVEELGSDEIDGVEVQGLSAEVSFEDLMEASGTDPSAMDAANPADMSGLTFPLEVWVDGDDQVRRIGFAFDAENMADMAGEDAGDIPSEMGDFSVGMTLDFSAYGEDIEITIPSDATDITDEFVEFFEETVSGG